MKLKEINRTAIQSWSPAQHHPIFLATGIGMQQASGSGLLLQGTLVFFFFNKFCNFSQTAQDLSVLAPLLFFLVGHVCLTWSLHKTYHCVPLQWLLKMKDIKLLSYVVTLKRYNNMFSPSPGTSAQQLDASFSTNASLEFFELDFGDPSLDMKSCGSFSSSHRYSKLLSTLLLLTLSLECMFWSCALCPQIPQTGLGSLWDGFRQPPIRRPHCWRREWQRHPLRSSKDHGWREWRDHCWEWQAHRTSESPGYQLISGEIRIVLIFKWNILEMVFVMFFCIFLIKCFCINAGTVTFFSTL